MSRVLAIMMVLMVCGVTTAATINVAADGSGDYTTIQAAIDAASNGDVILVAPGTYTGTGNEVVNTLGKLIIIKASGTPEETILDGEGARGVVQCSSGEGADTIIEGFAITGGNANEGGGIYCYDNSSPTIRGCEISNNTGGGIYCYLSSSPTITDCIISGNTANYDGGGIYCYDYSSPTITDCTITNNTANSGGGIYCSWGSPTISGCTISGNTANYDGGGIYCYDNSYDYSSPTITDCTITNNTANYDGGGISYYDNSNPTLTDTVVCGNDPDQIYPVDGWKDKGGNTVSDECPPPCPDVDGDGMVGVNDVLAVVAAWGSDDPDADVDGDGTVGINDLLAVIGTWGPCE